MIKKIMETNCPTCGGRCTVSKKSQYPNCNYMDYFALPYPDLTKLRKAYITYKEAQTGTIIMVDRIFRAIEEILECKD